MTVRTSLQAAELYGVLSGKLAPAAAFMTGKMKLSGDMGKAMKLEKMMGKLKSKL